MYDNRIITNIITKDCGSYPEDGANEHYETDDSNHDSQEACVLNHCVQICLAKALQQMSVIII